MFCRSKIDNWSRNLIETRRLHKCIQMRQNDIVMNESCSQATSSVMISVHRATFANDDQLPERSFMTFVVSIVDVQESPCLKKYSCLEFVHFGQFSTGIFFGFFDAI
jgi:hypothetical protein